MPIKFKLKVQLALRDMNQRQLSEETGIRPPTISMICTGKVKHIPVTALDKICRILNCQPGDLIEYVPAYMPIRSESKLSEHTMPTGTNEYILPEKPLEEFTKRPLLVNELKELYLVVH